jgi:hypothetical protein
LPAADLVGIRLQHLRDGCRGARDEGQCLLLAQLHGPGVSRRSAAGAPRGPPSRRHRSHRRGAHWGSTATCS